MLQRTEVTVKKTGPSKNNPEKYGWILDEGGTFWNVSLAQSQQATIGSKWEIAHHLNEKGYVQVAELKPVGQERSPVMNNGPEKGMLMKEAIALLAAGKSHAEVVEILLQADQVYHEFIGVRDGSSS